MGFLSFFILVFQEYVRERDDYASLTAYQQLDSVINNASRTDDALELVWENFARVNIFFRDVLIINIDEYPAYDLGTLFSNIGGTIGLWAGLSCITVIEIGFLIARLIIIAVKKCKRRNSLSTANGKVGNP